MTKPITKFDEVVEIYFESGCARLRFKEEECLKSIIKDHKSIQSFMGAKTKKTGSSNEIKDIA